MTDISASNLPQTRNFARYAFLSVLFLCTIGTTLTFPLIGEAITSAEYQQHAIILLLGWFSTAHVGTTIFYYVDRDFLPHVMERKTRYIYAPLLVIAGSVAAWGMTRDTPVFWIFWQVYHGWLLWHFMRQNIGVSALVAQATKAERIDSRDRLAITLVGVGAIIAATRFGPTGTFSWALTQHAFQVGLIIYLAGLGLGLFQIAKRVLERQNYVASAFILASLLFFLPTFIFDRYFPAIMSYAIAHALQYWLLMSLLAVGSGRMSGWFRSIGAFVFMFSVIYLFIYLSRQGDMWGTWAAWVAGIGIGITIAHFVIDADAWRLRESFQRNFVMARIGRYLKS